MPNTSDPYELLSAYVDQELNSDQFNRVNQLLASSADARLEVERLRKSKSFLASAPRLTAPPDLVVQLEAMYAAALRPAERRRPGRSWWLAGSFATAAGFAFWFVTGAMKPAPSIPLERLEAAHARYASDAAVAVGLAAASDYAGYLEKDQTHVP
jgi:anti-sigma factor RsiW